ncbi:hypothetical protein BDD30_0462 [Photorhabdus asymbiotica]|uniref:Uncharacterized protein n=1 Tax=Photorhabdus asymbiotica TaxID=291112 RepID=A0ABX9SRV2_9GAMM|nr:hypothetical protein BDD30_0462 [Photorhabdus asymbiotica]
MINGMIYPLSFKLPLCWLHLLTPVTSFAMLPRIRSLAVAMHLEIHRVYILQAEETKPRANNPQNEEADNNPEGIDFMPQ